MDRPRVIGSPQGYSDPMSEPERRWTELPAPPTNGSNGDEQYYWEPTRDYEPIQPESGLRAMLRKIWAPIAAAAALLVKFGAVIFKLKIFTVAGSMIVSVGAYALLGGWWFGARPRAADLRARDGPRARTAPAGRSRHRRRSSSRSWAPSSG